MGFLDRLRGAVGSVNRDTWVGVAAKQHEWSLYEEGREWMLDFCYSYEYEGDYYSGERQWHLLMPNEDKLSGALDPLKEFSVRVNPQKPEQSWLSDEELVAHGVDLSLLK